MNFNLQRFLTAQDKQYGDALYELFFGKKESHWIWFIFPQIAGLGLSDNAKFYAISSRDEAIAYLNHPVLGSRLKECAEVLLNHTDLEIKDIMGFPDDLKLKSSMTLFDSISDDQNIFKNVLDVFYNGCIDTKTIELLKQSKILK